MARPLRVLIVEDSLEDAAIVLRELKRAGYDIVSERVDNEASLLAALARQDWDIVLSDFAMPDFNGLHAFELIKEREIDVPFIFVSGRIGEDRAVEAMKRGASDYILKDKLARLAPAVQRELEDAEARRQRRQMLRSLQERELKLASIYNTVGDVIFQLAVERDGRYRFVSINQAFVSVTGLSLDQVVGKRVDEVIPEPSLSMVLGKYEEAIQGRKIVRWEETSDYPTGRLTGEVSVAPIFDEAGNCTHLVGAVHDITARKRAEERLRESEKRFRDFAEIASDWLWEMDSDFRFTYLSDRLERITGVPNADFLGKRHWEFAAESPERMAQHRAELEAHREIRDFVYAYRVRSRDLLYARLNGKPIVDEQGRFLGYRGTGSDVTAEMTARLEAERARQRLIDAIESVTAGFMLYDKDEKFVMANTRAHQMFPEFTEFFAPGAGFEDWVRASFRSGLVDRGGQDEEAFTRDRLGKFRHPPDFHEYPRSDGRWIRAYDRKTADGGTVSIRVDITDLKEREARLRESEGRYRNLIEGSIQGIVIVQDGRIAFCNDTLARIYSHDRAQDLIGTDPSLLAHVEDRERVVAQRTALLRGELTNYRIEYRGLRKDGAEIWLETIVHRIDWNGRPAAQAVVLDMTVHRTLERQLQTAQRMESVGRLAGGIAHDFNNILAVISAHSGFLLDALEKGSQAWEDAQIVQQSSAKAAALTRQLLAFSRKQVLQLQVININETVGNLEKMLRRLIGEDIELHTHYAPDLKLVRADESQIEQVVMNLLVNARDAMPRGGEATIETSNEILDDNYVKTHLGAKPGEYAMLAVTDTGTGMSEEIQQRIFEPFFTTKAAGKGTGLGLATVYGIVKQMNGSIYVYSELGKGTTFKVYFPVTQERRAGEEVSGVAAPAPAATETILVVEDDELVRRAAVRILKGQGYRVLESTGPEQGIEIARTHPGKIDLLLTDVVMPGISGRELWERVKAIRDVPVLFMSGYTDDAIVNHGILEGRFPFLDKPFSKDSLLAKVREVLDG